MTNATLRGKPDAGNPHVRFDEGEVASTKPRRGSLLYKKLMVALGMAAALAAGATEAEPGFVSLFNGRDLSGWEGATTNGRFRVDAEGCLVCVREGGWKMRPLNIWTAREYTNFVFRFEFQLSANVNNGVGIRAPKGDYVTSSGMEIQMLEDESSDYYYVKRKLKPYQYNCSVYGVIAARRQSERKGYLRPLGEWNEEEIRADGSHLTVTLNGEKVIDADLSKIDADGGTPDGQRHPGLRRMSGHICWCWHAGQVKYRNIRIREL